jgi:hypothetical protein
MPAQARKDLGLADGAHWRVFGSPDLAVAIVVGPHRSPRETLDFLLGGSWPKGGHPKAGSHAHGIGSLPD